jgi:copper/silver efflux system protein
LTPSPPSPLAFELARRAAAARYGLNIADVQSVVSGAIGGENVAETVEGLARFPINLRYPRDWRDTPERLVTLPILTPMGQQITLRTVAKVLISDGPPMLKSENARPSGWVYVDVRGRGLASVADDLRAAVAKSVPLEPGVSIAYSGQFEFLERANAWLKVVVPATLLIIFVLLYLTFRRVDEAVLIMGTLPFALVGGAWFLWAMGYNPVDRHGGGLHRAGGRGGGVRRGDAAVPEAGASGAAWRRGLAERCRRR